MLKKQFNRDIQLAFESEGSVVSDHPDSVWEITVRNGRKHKKYNKVASKMLGIYNRNNCNIFINFRMLHNFNRARAP